MINIKKLILLIPCTLLFAGCKVTYSFSGASISPEVKTVSIPRFPNNALLVAPILSSTLTEALQDRFSRQTRLTLVPEGGDLNFEGEITNYTSTPAAISGNEYAVRNLRPLQQRSVAPERRAYADTRNRRTTGRRHIQRSRISMVTRIMKRPVVQPARLERLTDDQLADVLKRYPWFDTARLILQSRTTAEDPQLRLRLQIAGWPEILLARPDTARSEADVIDRFLSREFRRIVPDPASFPAGEDLARESVREDPELISEELADIYARQGLYAKAKEIYARLSLLYPEKSVYFAEIIAGLDTKKSGK